MVKKIKVANKYHKDIATLVCPYGLKPYELPSCLLQFTKRTKLFKSFVN